METDPTSAALIAATLELVGEVGLPATTTRAIAERAGVNEVTLFRKFGTKTALLRAAYASLATTAAREFVRYTGDVEADLIHLATAYQQRFKQLGATARSLLNDVPRDPELADVTEGIWSLFNVIGDFMRRYQDEGLLDPEPVETLVPAFIAPIILPVIGQDAIPGVRSAAEAFDPRSHVRRFLYGRLASPGPSSPKADRA